MKCPYCERDTGSGAAAISHIRSCAKSQESKEREPLSPLSISLLTKVAVGSFILGVLAPIVGALVIRAVQRMFF